MLDYKVYIVDEMMGKGKSSAAINYINNSNERFLVITPYLDEVDRYKKFCPNKHFKEPIRRNGSKLLDIKHLLRNGENIVSTHALFQRFDKEVIDLCKSLNYNLIMDEVAEVVQECDIKQDDIDILLKDFCDVDDTGKLKWRADCLSYSGDFFYEVKNMCELDGVVIVRGKMLMWLFPVEVFKAFNTVYILTYMFNAQIQRYYYDYCNIEYSYIHVDGTDISNYHFVHETSNMDTINYNEIIHILDNNKMNVIGDNQNSLSKSWYIKYNKTMIIKQLKNNISNFFRHIRNDNSKDNLWTTFKDFKSQLSGKGYTKGFVPINMRATNAYKDRTSLAYTVNIFLNPIIKAFFQDHDIAVDEDGYALSEMLQWIWRSAIRDGKEIWIYVPSCRMRGLLENWIETVSKNS